MQPLTNVSARGDERQLRHPNGVISRNPIIAAGSWDDFQSPNRGFAWARNNLPGTNELPVVSAPLLTSSENTRGLEAAELRAILQTNTNVPPSDWIIVAGDFNTDNRAEAAINALTNNNFLSDSPIPTDQVSGGDPDTNMNRNKPYDYVLPSFRLRPDSQMSSSARIHFERPGIRLAPCRQACRTCRRCC
jgi:endonuclease/exonuclease/phosphatase family metal-dependent hydrolase